ncbi:protein-arginine kinase [Collibacillus ludicampi]|uniref:Protein-arginine kinase n=1 Tax=Collibacillus ludicampi TaxID=2771369 RepID=A0AAV4LEZ9_9BACL|nr:protein arginine kinase [Collibacillus ludicampi]GIM46089.1 protein-arginine kinase [Collibacillus ludicampi]
MSVSDFLKNATSKWMRDDGPESDIVISTRIRVARNLAKYPFPLLATDSQAEAIIEDVQRAIQQPAFRKLGNFELLRCKNLTELERNVLVEKHLISPNLAEEVRHGAVVLRDDEAVSIMINEEDHIRLQCIVPGLEISSAWQLANQLDDALELTLNYAFDEKRGYLTACPTNVGTGIRASVMMHLPGLVITNQIHRILQAISQVGLVVRGIYGEGSEAVGNLFQISNQLTLGQSESEILGNLQVVAKQIIEHERQARRQLMRDNREQLEDRICRSFGILSYARRIDSKETMQRLSDVRLGIDLGIIKGVSSRILKELMVMTRPAFLQKYAGQELAPGERDWRRASIIRERLRMDDSQI